MMIRIENSKGNKDRLVPISLKMMHLLDKYYQAYKPVEYLFNGQGSIQYSAASCNKLVKKYLGAKYHFHMLRHSCATRMHETGTDIFLIQKFLGHSSFKTTQIYTHISNASLCEIRTAI
jgi:integrase/recombinase XerD